VLELLRRGRRRVGPFIMSPGARGERQLVMPGQELGEIGRRERELKSLTLAFEEQTMPVDGPPTRASAS